VEGLGELLGEHFAGCWRRLFKKRRKHQAPFFPPENWCSGR
jgi:hypothetical protein